MNRYPIPRHLPRLHPLALAVGLLALASSGVTWALPQGAKAVSGQVTFSRQGAGGMLIQQRSTAGIVNWQGFSIDKGEAVRVQQPGAGSVLLNRVVGADPSRIFGQLSANGKVFLLNPNGVLFGASSKVDVGSLVASTLALKDEDFLAGRYRLDGGTSSGAAVVNQGRIDAGERGTVALLGGTVRNDGHIEARLGTVALAAGSKITLDLAGDGLSRITVTQAALDAQVANGGMTVADGGAVLLKADALNALIGDAVNHSGVVRARSLVGRNGRIVLDGGETGTTIVSGLLDASGSSATTGGEIQVLGRHVGLTGSAVLDASGAAGGGAVLVGGDLLGGNPDVRNASAIWMSSNATIHADATVQGDGGKVVLWGRDATRAHGTISARGGPRGGDGGFVETSGAFLDVGGARVDAGAAQGKAGQWLLDPRDISVGNAATGSVSDADGPDFEASGGSANVNAADISAALDNNTSVTISTGNADADGTGTLTVAEDVVIAKTLGNGAATLRLNAAQDIVIENGARITSISGPLTVELNSDFDDSGSGAIDIRGLTLLSNGGDVRLFGGADGPGAAARGSTARPDAVLLLNTTIDTRAPAGPGDGAITIRGTGRPGDPVGAASSGSPGTSTTAGGPGPAGTDGDNGGSGVLMIGSTFRAGSAAIVISGTAGNGASGGTGGSGGAGYSPPNRPEIRASAPGGNGGVGGVGGNGGSGGLGVATAGALIVETTSGAITIEGRGGAPGAGGPGGIGGTGGQGDAGTLGGSGSGGNGGDSGAGGSAGAAGVGVAILDGTIVRVASGALRLSSIGGAGAPGGNGAVGGLLGSGEGPGAFNGAQGAASAGGASSTGAAGLLLQSQVAGLRLEVSTGSAEISGIGGRGGDGSANFGAVSSQAGNSGGAGISGLTTGVATLDVTGAGTLSWVGTGADGGSGSNGAALGFGGSGGNGGAGILQNWRMRAGETNLSLRGVGGAGGKGGDAGFGGIGGFGGAGISVNGGAVTTTLGNISLVGVGGSGGPQSLSGAAVAGGTEGFNGTGVFLGATADGGPTLGSQSGGIGVFGLARSPSEIRNAIGLDLTNAAVTSSGGGSIDLRGRSEAAGAGLLNPGVRSSDSIVSTGGGPGRIVISGESTANAAAVIIENAPSSLRRPIGGSATTGDIVIRALNAGAGDAIDLETALLQTTGHVNLTPGGVSAAGVLTLADAVPISLANPVFVGESFFGPFGFALSANDLASIQDGTAGIVIGSNTHTAALVANLAFTWLDNLTLQNGGAGSAGIFIASPVNNPGNAVMLSSGGPVTQRLDTAPISADSLLLHGTQPESNFQLTHVGNNVAQLAAQFETTKSTALQEHGDVNYSNSVGLSVGPSAGAATPAGTGFDSATQLPVAITAGDSTIAGDFAARALTGSMRLAQNVRTLGSNITLVSAGPFVNDGSFALAPGNDGSWRVWADTWVGESRGNLQPTTPSPSFYGCAYGAASCASGVTIPSTGNRFIYASQPTATVIADNQSRLYGGSNAPPTFANPPAGLINGDTAADAFIGTLAHTAQSTSGVGAYPIVSTSLSSPVGYSLTFAPGTLSVTPAPLTVTADNKLRLEGLPNPPATATVTGLVAGDTRLLADAAGLRLSTRASVLSPAGQYSIDVAPFNLDNYTVTTLNGTLTVAANGAMTRQLRETIWQASDLYGRNQGLPAMCTAIDANIFDWAHPGGDALSIEWSRLRQRPNLSNCVDLAQRNDCSDF